MTNTVSLVLTGAGSAIGSGPELTGQGARVRRFGTVTALGGAAGAAALLLSPAHSFELVVPVLIAGAAVLLLIQPRVKSLSARPDGERSIPLTMALFAAAMYVGYFGAGGGVLLLAVLGMMIDEALARLNAIKNVISGLANFVAAVGFALFAPVRWSFVLPLAAGFLIGGWTGPRWSAGCRRRDCGWSSRWPGSGWRSSWAGAPTGYWLLVTGAIASFEPLPMVLAN